MKRGDVFRIKGEEQIFYTDDVSPGGTIFAHMFDLDKGAYGQPVSFQSTITVEILFNTFLPEEEIGWEYCNIIHNKILTDDSTNFTFHAFDSKYIFTIKQYLKI